MTRAKTSLLLWATAFAPFAAVFAASTVTETEIELPTYPFSDPDPVPATSHERYPYFFIDGTTDRREMRKWKAVILENEKVRVTMLPEIGGKVWGAVDKTTGREFIYFNHAVKFRNISQRGPWCSGGIEFNFGIIGHAPSTATPVSYFTRVNADGSASYFASDSELICGTTWQVEVNLPADEERFFTRTTWFNGSGFPAPYYQWMTAAYSARGNPSLEFPGRAYIGHGGDSHAWPVDPDGHRLSVYEGNRFGGPKSEHVLNGDNGIFGIWWGGKGTDGFGSIHRNHLTQKYGRKVWLWALSRDGGIWEDLLTDTDGQYVELQSGRCFCQPHETYRTPFKHPTFAPGATDTFEEEWGVVRDRSVFDRAWNEENYVERPQFMPKDFDWESAYGHYVMGEQMLRQKMDRAGEAELRKSLAKEPCFAPALDLLATLAVRRGRYAEARAYAEKALALDTYDPEANYADGLAAFAEGDLRKARERLGLAAYAPKFRPAAFARVAQAELREGNWRTAEAMADKALLANGLELNAYLAKIVAVRMSGDADRAKKLAEDILAKVPLFHGARRELNLLDRSSEPFERYVRNEFPHEVYLALGTWYEDAGLLQDAQRLFRKAGETNPIGGIRFAYALEKTGGSEAAKAAGVLNAVARRPIAFALPFRRESLPALEYAADRNPCWKFRYYAAVCLAANAWDAEADARLDSCGDEPDDEIFYLYRASRRTGEAALSDLRRAERTGGSWRTGYALYRHFAQNGRWPQALGAVKPYALKFDANKIKLAYAAALMQNRLYRETVDYLEKTTFLPSEGGDNASGTWIDAWRGIAEEALAKGDRAAAEQAVRKALSYPERLGAGRPYELNFAPSSNPKRRNPLADWSEELRAMAK